MDRIPVLECTRKICNAAGVNLYRLISSGTMIITAFDGEKLVAQLKERGVNAAVIGKITDGGRYVIAGGERKELVPQEKDEIYNVFK